MDDKKEWKKTVGFPINYSSENSDDEFDQQDVVMRHPQPPPRGGGGGGAGGGGRSSHMVGDFLLADEGDGALADLLGTTPPRERIRNKSKRRAVIEAAGIKINTKDIYDPTILGRRVSSKLQRKFERDSKLGAGSSGERADSLPATAASAAASAAAVPTLVESCSRFMSLASRLKCREQDAGCGGDAGEGEGDDLEPPLARRGGGGGGGGEPGEEELPPSRVNFHKTFSMLINMGNIDKGCRRTISREEQVWQNELKDLIWLELVARVARRSLAEQDAFLCAQRTLVPDIITNILTFKFVNKNPCPSASRRLPVDRAPQQRADAEDDLEIEDEGACCLSFHCAACTGAVGAGLRAVAALLDAYHRALTLYPSSHALTHDHPPVATARFKSRLKALCLWYNTALHMRLKVVAVRRMIRTMASKQQRQHRQHRPARTDTDPGDNRSEAEPPRACTVRFELSDTPTPSSSNNSNHSDCSRHKDSGKETDDDAPARTHATVIENHTERESQKPARSQDEEDTSKDVVDRVAEPATPEIVISDARYDTADTADTAASSESGYTSGGDTQHAHHAHHALHTHDARGDHVYDIGDLSDITQLRLLNKAPVSIYRSYHQEMLKTQGVRRCMSFINKMRCSLLHKVYLTFEHPHGSSAPAAAGAGAGAGAGAEGEVFDDAREETDEAHDDDHTYELKRYGCFSAEALSMRLPSYRSHFLLLCCVCMEGVHDYLELRLQDRPDNPSCLTVKQLIHELKEGLDIATEMRADFARNIQVALAGQSGTDAVRSDLLLVVRSFDDTVETVLKQYLSYLRTMSAVEQMSRASLQREWDFTARLAKRARCAVLLAPTTFSEIACNQLDRVRKQFEQKFEQLDEFEKTTVDPDNEKHFVYTICRAVQAVYASERDAALHAAQWARCLASRLARNPHHAQPSQRIFDSLVSIRDLIVAQTREILERSRPDVTDDLRDSEALGARVRELMLQIYRLGFEIHKELHRFVHDSSVGWSSASARRASAVTSRAGEGDAAGEAGGGGGGGPRFLRSESIAEDAEVDKVYENDNNFAENQTYSSIEQFLVGAPAGAGAGAGAGGARVASAALESRAAAARRACTQVVARAIVDFAHCWMQFVIERCEKGRGLRPRWAHQGLEFLMLACDPRNTRHLSDQEFDDLKRKMDACISHVIGSRPPTPRAAPAAASPPAPDSATADSKARRRPNRIHSPLPPGGRHPAPSTPPLDHEPNFNFPEVDFAAHSARVYAATRRLDAAREQKLAEARAVGRVLVAPAPAYEPKLRQVNFKWQRGLKIGQGTFGKVYTVVNTETGQLLAMKEIAVGAGDRRALQRAANELRVLEGVIHPHLVRYYGAELHREEMLLFMELCVEGSLEALLAASGALQEQMVRRYTKQLTSAIAELHKQGVAHRDIKSGNIFLTNEGHCLKLGDFGCAVKIRAHTTARGELVGHVGTQAYMAPEVFMKATGHGRAADVWSLGCVVAEMASGKRPFSEYDSNVQIMFVVGMGGRPDIPPALSAEGRAFCASALTHEPDLRPSAQHLLMHHFLKLKTDDECECEPAYLLT